MEKADAQEKIRNASRVIDFIAKKLLEVISKKSFVPIRQRRTSLFVGSKFQILDIGLICLRLLHLPRLFILLGLSGGF